MKEIVTVVPLILHNNDVTRSLLVSSKDNEH